MKYCQQCGAQLPDQAQFCRNCGAKITTISARTSDDGEGIVIDAPEEATVTISEEPKDTKAPDTSGEFFIASWGGTEAEQPQGMKEPKKAAVSPKMQDPKRVEEPVASEEVEPEENSEKSKGIFGIILTFAKVMLLVLSIVFSAVIIKGFFKGDTPEAPKQEQTMQPDMNVQDNPEVPAGYTTNESEQNGTVNNEGEDELLLESNEDHESNSGFGKIEDMPLHERAEYYEGLLERSEKYLQDELAKGADANQNEIRQLRKDIDMLRKALKQIKQ